MKTDIHKTISYNINVDRIIKMTWSWKNLIRNVHIENLHYCGLLYCDKYRHCFFFLLKTTVDMKFIEG